MPHRSSRPRRGRAIESVHRQGASCRSSMTRRASASPPGRCSTSSVALEMLAVGGGNGLRKRSLPHPFASSRDPCPMNKREPWGCTPRQHRWRMPTQYNRPVVEGDSSRRRGRTARESRRKSRSEAKRASAEPRVLTTMRLRQSLHGELEATAARTRRSVAR